MPKFYAVAKGREGPKVYKSWDEVPVHKAFSSMQQAETWLACTSPFFPKQRLPEIHVEYTSFSFPSGSDSIPVGTSTSAMALSAEQQAVLGRVSRGQSTFFSGSAGTGKSVLLRAVIDQLGGSECPTLGITASTGIAAIAIGGSTLHSWAGIGIGNETAKKVGGMFLGQGKYERVLNRWRTVKTLIIDESACSSEEIARIVRGNNSPFGGIQVRVEQSLLLYLTVDSKAFVALLNAMRFGKIENAEAFKALERRVTYTDGIQPTELLSRRDEVDRANMMRLNQLPGECQTYMASDYSGHNSNGERISEARRDQLLNRLVVPQIVHLKNLVQGQLVNGSLGQIVGFFTSVDAISRHLEVAREGDEQQPIPPERNGEQQLWPLVRFTNGSELLMVPQEFTINNADGQTEARRDQIPLILAWALSVHKAQGQTIERVRVDLKRTFEMGQGALMSPSRAPRLWNSSRFSTSTLQSKFLPTFVFHFCLSDRSTRRVTAHPRVLQWYADCQRESVEDEMDSEVAMDQYYSY
ncbi:PIF1-like helicase-domain-containing protein [Mycena filopes]|nr:PIF1-like helicase-domain-containing protein [Mycena filopes]